MGIVLDGFSAYEFWMSSLSDQAHYLDVPNPQLTQFNTFSCGDLSRRMSRNDAEAGVLELLVRDKSERLRTNDIICNCWGPKPLPPQSICKIGDNLYAVSPELCLLRIAPRLTFLEFVRAISNFMSIFCFSHHNRIDLIRREPLLTKDDIRSFLQNCKGLTGARLTERAVKWAVERAASPREVSVDLALSLPSHLGGQNVGPLEANAPVLLDDAARPLTTKSYLIADVAFPGNKNLFAEYNSDKFHDTEEQKQYDFEKITALQRMKKTVVPISTRQFNNYDAFSSISNGLRAQLGKRDRRSEEFDEVRRKTHGELLSDEREQRKDTSLFDTARWQTLLPYMSFDE